jgi:N-acetyl-gamma-glutamyl-phosphate reductase
VSDRVRVSVAGGTGYAGVELLRILLRHPRVEVVRASSEQYSGKRLDEVYPAFRGRTDLVLEPLDADRLADGADVICSALPHGTAARTVARALERGARAIDLSADFRFRDAETFRRWYGEHPVPQLLSEAVYGIPEFSRDAIRSARLVAAPGCYPTGALLGLVPLARAGRIGEGVVIVDSKSGASGAGRAAKTELLFCEIEESVRAYAVGSHRHGPEIEQELRLAGGPEHVVFTPHILPLRRGILSTIYVPLADERELDEAFVAVYEREPFVHCLGSGVFPDVRDVRGTNDAQIGWTVLAGRGMAIVVTAIDNLGRGAAAQAVQCLNVMQGFDERSGLDFLAAVP